MSFQNPRYCWALGARVTGMLPQRRPGALLPGPEGLHPNPAGLGRIRRRALPMNDKLGKFGDGAAGRLQPCDSGFHCSRPWRKGDGLKGLDSALKLGHLNGPQSRLGDIGQGPRPPFGRLHCEAVPGGGFQQGENVRGGP